MVEKLKGKISEHSIQQLEKFKEKISSSEDFTVRQKTLILKASALMVELHSDQSPRSDGTPYVEHPLDIATKVFDHMKKKDADVVIAALLHDSVEDQETKLAEKVGSSVVGKTNRDRALDFIYGTYGVKVRDIVSALSNPDFDEIIEKKGIKKGTDEYTKGKNAEYVKHVKEAIENPDVALVKLFDFTANALSLDTTQDPKSQVKFLLKYQPVVRVFINRLEAKPRLNLQLAFQAKMIATLFDAEKNKMPQQLNAAEKEIAR